MPRSVRALRKGVGQTHYRHEHLGENVDKELPPGSTAAAADKIRFAEMRVGDQVIFGNDLPEDKAEAMRGFNVALHTKSEEQARELFAGLATGGNITTPLTSVEWAALFGMVTDRFGVPWLILALKS